jgi:ATP sulfurylase
VLADLQGFSHVAFLRNYSQIEQSKGSDHECNHEAHISVSAIYAVTL